jgi:hypothetical protein
MTTREELARDALIRIIRDYGRMLGEDSRRCEALLKDFCPDGRAQVHLLVIAARAEVPKQLMSSAAGSSRELLVARLARTLEEDYAVTAEAACWAVECWALALGVAVAVARLTAPVAVAAQRATAVQAAAIEPSRPLRRKWPAGQRFVDNGDGTVTDAKTGLIWADSDNGSDINWKDAKKYCACKGNGWELPAVAQLQGLVDASGKYWQECADVTCKVTSLIRLSGWFFWSSEANGSSEAWAVSLFDGVVYPSAVDLAYYGRALCVRRS